MRVRLPNWRPTSRRRTTDHDVTSPSPTGDGTLRLGSGEMSDVGVSPKAALLDRAKAAGLDVPDGFVVPDGVDLLPEHHGWLPHPRRPTPTGDRVAVRSAFGAEDRDDASMAGWFDSLLDVDPTADTALIDTALIDAVTTVRRSADRHQGSFRLDVLVMAMVDARQAGVAFSEPGTYDDLVNVVDGLADDLVGGRAEGVRVELPRLEPTEDGWPRRLQRLLRTVRAEFGDASWDIEWADDGATCWLIQIRPISAAPLRNETLTAANHAEILPALPSHLMTSIIDEAGPDLFDWYRRRIPGLPADRDFLHVIQGRPMINLSLLEDMMRHLGLPTRLVAESIGGGHQRDHPASIGRLARRSPSLIRLGWSQIMAVVFSRRNRERAASIGRERATTFAAAVDELHEAYVALVTGMFPLSSAIGPPLGLLRATGTLYEHAARHHTITTELSERARAVRQAEEIFRSTVLDDFLVDFGHRGVYESDIARPRYRDDPGSLGRASQPNEAAPEALDSTASRIPRRTLRGRLTMPIWLLAARPLAARELLRHESMRSFANIRDSFKALAAAAATDGRLREVDDIWLLTADEARRLDTGWAPGAAFWAQRSDERRALADVDVPHVVGRFDHPSQWLEDDSSRGSNDALHGLPLTAGTVTGQAWVLDEPASELPDGLSSESTVLVARSIDAGWISTIELVAAVVVEIGGDLSHGSILVREIGIPAVTNVAKATRRITTGDTIEVHAGSGTVTLG